MHTLRWILESRHHRHSQTQGSLSMCSQRHMEQECACDEKEKVVAETRVSKHRLIKPNGPNIAKT